MKRVLLPLVLLACAVPTLAFAQGESPNPLPPPQTPPPLPEPSPTPAPARPAPPEYQAPRDAPPEYQAPRNAPPEYNPAPAPEAPPFAHRGFQLALRTGVSIPFGSTKKEDAGDATIFAGDSHFSNYAAWQVPLGVDIGGKIGPYVFLGGYLDLAFGGPNGTTESQCHGDCASASIRIGPEILVSMAPHDRLNPWLGYGLGVSVISVGRDRDAVTYSGVDFARLMAGLDIRLSKTFGIGPYVNFTIGKYAGETIRANNVEVDTDISGRTFHYWLTLGPRFVFFP